MKPHIANYISAFGLSEGDWIKCELPDCETQAVHIHHIIFRSHIFGEERDHINNLMALCHEHHSIIHDGDGIDREYLQMIHQRNLDLI